MPLNRIRFLAFTILATVGSAALATAADSDAAWLGDRQARFSTYQEAHPRLDLDIATVKARTAAMIAASAPLSQSDLDRPPLIWRASLAPLEIWDGADLPQMVVIPAGEYTMGSPETAPQRDANEGPRHRVRIGYALAVGKYEVTVGEFSRFVADTHYVTGDVCYTYEDGRYADRSPRTWRRPTGAEDAPDSLPAMCLTWNDGQAYAAWLAKRTGRPYRLMSEAEYEYANRAGSTTTYWWGDQIGTNRSNCNGCGSAWDLKQITPAGSFAPNPFGLYDTSGNAWSWMSDCWNDSYADAPTDGSAKLTGDCATRTVRGGGWSTHAWILRTARRVGDAAAGRHGTVGFRVAFTL